MAERKPSAFFLFSRERRPILKERFESDPDYTGGQAVAISKELAYEWRNLKESEKDRYRQMARGSSGSPKMTERKPSAFFLFSKEMRPILKERFESDPEYADYSGGQAVAISKELAYEWRNLEESEKDRYRQMARGSSKRSPGKASPKRSSGSSEKGFSSQHAGVGNYYKFQSESLLNVIRRLENDPAYRNLSASGIFKEAVHEIDEDWTNMSTAEKMEYE